MNHFDNHTVLPCITGFDFWVSFLQKSWNSYQIKIVFIYLNLQGSRQECLFLFFFYSAVISVQSLYIIVPYLFSYKMGSLSELPEICKRDKCISAEKLFFLVQNYHKI